MKNISFTKGILLGVGLMGASTSIVSSAEAAPRAEKRDVKEARKDVKEARKEVKQERKDVQRADNPGERRDAREDLRDAKRDLSKEQRDLKNEKRDLNRPTYNNNRPNYNNSNLRTIEGRVTNDLNGNGFVLRTNNGASLRVTSVGSEPNQLSTGDIVRVYGVYNGSGFLARNVSITRNQ